ncbi:hypothetical protein [Pararhizobium sp.]|uniref:hypothetical protein n=1 Tax=Pararhizobium sp. TaxID=1977563 RepID=UPI003D130758
MTPSLVIGFALPAVVLLVAFGVVMTVRAEEKERAEWQSYVDENDCHVVEVAEEQSSSTMSPSKGFDGKLTLSIHTVRLDARECWLCRDGIRRWKKKGLALDKTRPHK